MGGIDHPETSVRNYYSALCNISEEHGSNDDFGDADLVLAPLDSVQRDLFHTRIQDDLT